jgi:CRP-like cAMP-binding protein
MIDKLLMKMRARDELSADEERALRDAATDVVDYPADKTIIPAGKEIAFSTLLLEGLMARYKDLSQGQRQITELHVPGDFADLHSFSLKRLDHSIMTLTPCRILKFPHDRLTTITERFPHLTRVLWFLTNLDACIHREWEVSLGRRTAIARLAHLFCELRARLEVVGLADGGRYALPITQAEVAECMGLTSVHVNRVLKELREAGLVDFKSGRVTIHDMDALARVAEFTPAYLYLDRRSL